MQRRGSGAAGEKGARGKVPKEERWEAVDELPGGGGEIFMRVKD